MKRLRALAAALALSGCGGLAWNTTVAENPAVRRAMADSVVIGKTTETEFVTRWGLPVEKVRQGAQVEYIYRDMLDQHPQYLVLYGDSTRYVIVTFQYGRAIGVRTNETEGCRALFPPRPPGPGFDNPTVVHPVSTCEGLYRPPVGPAPEGAFDGAGGALPGDPVRADIMPGGKADPVRSAPDP